MKKFVSIILALTMVLALGSFALADSLSGATTGKATVKLELAPAGITWEIPPEITIDSTARSSGGTDKVTVSDDWRVEYGKVWKIGVNDVTVTLTRDGVGAGIGADVEFADLELNNKAGCSTEQAVTVRLRDGEYIDHLAGSYSAEITFECSYNDAN